MAAGKRLVFCSRLHQAFIHLNCEFLDSVKRAWFSAYWHKCHSEVDSFLKVMLNHSCWVHGLQSEPIRYLLQQLGTENLFLDPDTFLNITYFSQNFFCQQRGFNFKSKLWGTSDVILFKKPVFIYLADLGPKVKVGTVTKSVSHISEEEDGAELPLSLLAEKWNRIWSIPSLLLPT